MRFVQCEKHSEQRFTPKAMFQKIEPLSFPLHPLKANYTATFFKSCLVYSKFLEIVFADFNILLYGSSSVAETLSSVEGTLLVQTDNSRSMILPRQFPARLSHLAGRPEEPRG